MRNKVAVDAFIFIGCSRIFSTSLYYHAHMPVILANIAHSDIHFIHRRINGATHRVLYCRGFAAVYWYWKILFLYFIIYDISWCLSLYWARLGHWFLSLSDIIEYCPLTFLELDHHRTFCVRLILTYSLRHFLFSFEDYGVILIGASRFLWFQSIITHSQACRLIAAARHFVRYAGRHRLASSHAILSLSAWPLFIGLYHAHHTASAGHGSWCFIYAMPKQTHRSHTRNFDFRFMHFVVLQKASMSRRFMISRFRRFGISMPRCYACILDSRKIKADMQLITHLISLPASLILFARSFSCRLFSRYIICLLSLMACIHFCLHLPWNGRRYRRVSI